ncbi:hypothetical protein ABPG72_002598 [Tetrahymena utriculariae]
MDILQSITYPEIPCKCQFQENSQCINIQSLKEDEVFACDNCVFLENNSSKYLQINKIIQSQKHDVFLGWPYLDDKELIQQIRYFSFFQDNNQKNKKIEKFFNDFREEFNSALEQLKKNTLNYQNLICEDSSNLLSYYQSISQLDDLKNIIIDKQSNKQQKSNQIFQIINKKKEESTKNTNEIKQLIEKINQYPKVNQQQNQNSNQTLFAKLQPSSNLILNNLAKLDSIISKKKQNKIQEPYQYDIEISTFNNSKQNSKIAYDNDGNQKFEVVSQTSYLKNDYKHFFVGLVGQSHKDNQYIYSNTNINSFAVKKRHNDRGVSKIVKGKCLRDVKYPDEYNQIEITFCVKNKLFQVSDYPNKQNINEINDDKLNLIDTNQQHFLGFELYYQYDSITILQFEEFQI